MVRQGREKRPVRSEFDGALLAAVDEGLLVIGDGVAHVIYHHIEKSFNVRREEIPEKLIAKKLYYKLGLSFEEHDSWTLVDYADPARPRS